MVDSGFIIALLRDRTIRITHLDNLDSVVQTVTVEPSLRPFALSSSPYGISIRDVARDQRMELSRIPLLGGSLASSVTPPGTVNDSSSPPAEGVASPVSAEGFAVPTPDISMPTPDKETLLDEPASGSGLTPPASPKPFARQPIAPSRGSSLLGATAPVSIAPVSRMPFSTTVAETLVVGPNTIQSLSPTPIVLKLEELCASAQMDRAMSLVDDERRKGRRGEVDADKVTHSATLRFLYLFLAFKLVGDRMFKQASDYLLRGKVDPRLIVRLFPVFRGKLIGSAEEVEVYRGLASLLDDLAPIEDKGGSDKELDEYQDAKEMLAEVLRKTRVSRRKGGGSRGSDSRKIDYVRRT